MKKLVAGLAVGLLSLVVYANGPWGPHSGPWGPRPLPGAGAADTSLKEYLDATERSDDGITHVRIDRWERWDGWAGGFVRGSVAGKNFYCALASYVDLLKVKAAAEAAVITVDQGDIESCYGEPLWPITFDCVASGYYTSQGVANEGRTYYLGGDDREEKTHSFNIINAVDCVASMGEDIVLDAQSGIVWDGTAEVYKYIQSNLENE